MTASRNLTARLSPEVRQQVLDLIRLIAELRQQVADLEVRVEALEP